MKIKKREIFSKQIFEAVTIELDSGEEVDVTVISTEHELSSEPEIEVIFIGKLPENITEKEIKKFIYEKI